MNVLSSQGVRNSDPISKGLTGKHRTAVLDNIKLVFYRNQQSGILSRLGPGLIHVNTTYMTLSKLNLDSI